MRRARRRRNECVALSHRCIIGGHTPEKEGASSVNVLETERLNLRQLDADDAAFVVELLNEPSFLHNIGDKGVRTIEDAVQYILTGPVDSYARHGFGLWLVELKNEGTPAGICGLVKRDTLPDVDIGYAFLSRFRSRGYASESAAAVMNYALGTLGLKRVLAITIPDNAGSIKVLEKIGLKFDRLIRLSDDAPEIMLFASDA
jgi:[ribosomal protein S5]-alanine N-acetyltransferase